MNKVVVGALAGGSALYFLNESLKDQAVEQDDRERAELEKRRKEAHAKRVEEQSINQKRRKAKAAEKLPNTALYIQKVLVALQRSLERRRGTSDLLQFPLLEYGNSMTSTTTTVLGVAMVWGAEALMVVEHAIFSPPLSLDRIGISASILTEETVDFLTKRWMPEDTFCLLSADSGDCQGAVSMRPPSDVEKALGVTGIKEGSISTKLVESLLRISYFHDNSPSPNKPKVLTVDVPPTEADSFDALCSALGLFSIHKSNYTDAYECESAYGKNDELRYEWAEVPLSGWTPRTRGKKKARRRQDTPTGKCVGTERIVANFSNAASFAYF